MTPSVVYLADVDIGGEKNPISTRAHMVGNCRNEVNGTNRGYQVVHAVSVCATNDCGSRVGCDAAAHETSRVEPRWMLSWSCVVVVGGTRVHSTFSHKLAFLLHNNGCRCNIGSTS
eukprot:m.1109809 g.1109809  ORF g.1109809 m.1109809 type:complete len:116 (-) comp24355_c0_seq3:2919-3266(-)